MKFIRNIAFLFFYGLDKKFVHCGMRLLELERKASIGLEYELKCGSKIIVTARCEPKTTDPNI